MKRIKFAVSLTVLSLFLTTILYAVHDQPSPGNDEAGSKPQETSVTTCDQNTFVTSEEENNVLPPHAGPVASKKPRTYCRFVPERKDDFAWENDKIAFRTYGPALKESVENSGIDCWLKRVDYPIIDKWYKSEDYHTDHGEGLDSYKVGDSRGCGGTALWIDGEMVLSNVYKDWKVIKNDKDKSEFLLTYEYQVGKDVYTEDKVISIKLGDRLFKSTSTFKKNGKPVAGQPVAIGLVIDENHKVFRDLEKGWIATWGKNLETELGTGVVMDPEKIDAFIIQNSGKKLKDHALIITKTNEKGQVMHYAGYGWSAAKEITTPEKWNAYLADF